MESWDEVDHLVVRKKKCVFLPVWGVVFHQAHNPIGSNKQDGKCWNDSMTKKISSPQHPFIWCHVAIMGLQCIHLVRGSVQHQKQHSSLFFDHLDILVTGYKIKSTNPVASSSVIFIIFNFFTISV